MPKRQLILRILFGNAIAFCALTASGQQSNATVRSLSLRDCIETALEHNLNLQIGRLSPAVARYRWKTSRGIYDPVLTLSAAKTFVDQPAQLDPKKTGTDAEYELQADPFGPGLSGRLPYGLTYNFNWIATYAHVFTIFPSNVFDLTGPAFVNGFFPNGLRNTNAWFQTAGVSLAQPLLRDFWIDIYSLTIQTNKKDLQISEQMFKGLVMTNIAAVETNYYDVVLGREQIKVQRKSLEVASQLLSDVQKQVRAGTLRELDTKQAEAAVETARSVLAGAEGAYITAKNNLKNRLSDRLQDWMSTEIEPSENLLAINIPPDSQESWMNALTSRPDLLAMRLELEKQHIVLRYYHNQLFPALNVTGSYGFQEEMHSFSDSMNELRHGANAYYSAGLLLSVPVRNVLARNNYNAGKVANQQAILSMTKLQQDIITEVDNAVKLVQSTFIQVGATRKAREFAEAALDSQIKMFNAGEVTPFMVLEFQRNVTAARSAEVLALAEFNKAKALLALSEGTILQKHNINLKLH